MDDGKKIVWILGAGFSKSLGAPLLSELLTTESLRKVQLADLGDQRVQDNMVHASGIAALYRAGRWRDPRPEMKERQWEHAEEFIEALDRAANPGFRRKDLAFLAGQVAGADKFYCANGPTAQEVRDCAVRMVAAECCEFIKMSDPLSERWASYKAWVGSLRQDRDVLITFNYDRVLEVAATEPDNVKGGAKCSLWIPTPDQMRRWVEGADNDKCGPGAWVFKLHGSVDWIKDSTRIIRAKEIAPYEKSDAMADIAALYCKPEELALATPGPTKLSMIEPQPGKADTGLLASLWKRAGQEIIGADRIVMLGYRMPPTDAFTRTWLVDKIRNNEHVVSQQKQPLVVHTVLGADLHHEHSTRLTGLLESLDSHEAKRIWVKPWPMFAEDFVSAITREQLLLSTGRLRLTA